MIQAALQALVPNAVPGMIPGVFPGVAPSALRTSGTLLDAHPVEVPGMCTGALSVISPPKYFSHNRIDSFNRHHQGDCAPQ